jgi:hypothetical protein
VLHYGRFSILTIVDFKESFMRAFVFSMVSFLLLSGCGVQKTGEDVQNTIKEIDGVMKEAELKNAKYNEAQKAYAAANDKMHAGMGTIPADADEAFMAGMIPHHQGAVDMANVVLKHGKDPEVRALAQTVIAVQEHEIKQMQKWMSTRGLKAAPAVDSAVSDNAIDHSKMGH